jgi:hypothetical protein
VSIDIPSGTEILDSAGLPVDEITVAPTTGAPLAPQGYFLIQAFDFGPDGTYFDPFMEITVEYDLSQLPAGQEPVIAYYDSTAGEWVFVTGHVNTAEGTITFNVEHFTTYAVLGYGAATSEAGGIALWVWIIIGFVALLALVLIAGLLIQRRSAPAKIEAEVKPDITPGDDSST